MNPSAGLRSELRLIRVGKGRRGEKQGGDGDFEDDSVVSGLGDWMVRGAIGHDRECRGWCSLQRKLVNLFLDLCNRRHQRAIQGLRFNQQLYQPMVLEFSTEAELEIPGYQTSVCFTLLLRLWSAWESMWSGKKKMRAKVAGWRKGDGPVRLGERSFWQALGHKVAETRGKVKWGAWWNRSWVMKGMK